jgi:outer membrane receptor protein involved in Fe transport
VDAKVNVSIAALPVREALQAFGAQTGFQVLFRSEGLPLEQLTCAPVSGQFSPAEALDRLLAKTGLKYEFVNDKTVRVAPTAPISSVAPSEERGMALRPNERGEGGAARASLRIAEATELGSDRDVASIRTHEKSAEPAELEEVVVTGSHIKRAKTEGAAPVTIITGDEMVRQGFTTVYEALATLTQQTGTVETQVTPTASTPNAAALNLRGLGPGRVLVLFNGHRAADYPLPFDGRSNIVNLRAIPLAALERVEILSGGASAIYGSDAVSGVINFIMREHFDGIEADVRLGDTWRGDSQSQRAQVTGGLHDAGFNAVYSFEYFSRKPLFAVDTRYMSSLSKDPTGQGATSLPLNIVYSLLGGQLVDPTQAVCSQFGPTVSDQSFSGLGATCGDTTGPAQFTIRNKTEDKSAFFNASYDFSNGLQAFGSLSLWQSDSGVHTAGPSWGPESQIVFDADNFDYLIPQRFLTLSETGREPSIKFDELAWDTLVGVRGKLADDKYSWELTYHHSGYDAKRDARELLAQEVSEYFLGTLVPGADPLGLGAPVYSGVNRSRLLQPVSRADYDSFSAFDHTRAVSSNDQLGALLTGELFDLPAGAVKFAGVFEAATQDYDIHLDPGVAAGKFYGVNNAFPGGGSRDRYAMGLEMAAPLLDSVRLTLAGRYDKYNDITDVNDAVTYNAGLEFRPIQNLLLRGSYATSFRAPDMQFVFAGASTTSQGFLDVLRCRRDFQVTDLGQCTSPAASGIGQFVSRGNSGLKEETGKSWTAGIVWNATQALTLTADYYNIRLDDLVDDLSTDYILRTEADCRLGSTITGQTVNGQSALCQFIGGLVARHLPSGVGADTVDFISAVTAEPINRAMQSTSGIDAALRYQLDTAQLGKFFYTFSWTHVLEENRQEFAADPVQAYRDDPNNRDLRSRISSTLTWRWGAFSQTLFADIQGSRPRFNGVGRTRSFDTYNYSASYQASAALKLSLVVDNLFDADPRIDPTFSSYPYFYSSNINPYGREVFVEASYKFK